MILSLPILTDIDDAGRLTFEDKEFEVSADLAQFFLEPFKFEPENKE